MGGKVGRTKGNMRVGNKARNIVNEVSEMHLKSMHSPVTIIKEGTPNRLTLLYRYIVYYKGNHKFMVDIKFKVKNNGIGSLSEAQLDGVENMKNSKMFGSKNRLKKKINDSIDDCYRQNFSKESA